MEKCEVCERERKCVSVRDVFRKSVSVCARCRRQYFPTQEERFMDNELAERLAERDAELYAENGLCGFEF